MTRKDKETERKIDLVLTKFQLITFLVEDTKNIFYGLRAKNKMAPFIIVSLVAFVLIESVAATTNSEFDAVFTHPQTPSKFPPSSLVPKPLSEPISVCELEPNHGPTFRV